MDGKSLDILSDKLNKLKEIVPEAFTEDKVDWEKLKASLGDVNIENERYNLNWAGKSDAFRVLQQRTSATLRPIPEESYPVGFSPLSKGGDKEGVPEVGNLFIEGENLEVLKVLQKSYFGKIKMIYIDPPYNTGNDSFIYPDKFAESKEEYLKRIGDKSEEGYLLKEGFFRKNSKDGGHYHSNWLSMMYPRLYIVRNLLRDDGVIFVSIDDNEVHNLRMILNEIFGEENFIAEFIWKRRASSALAEKLISADHEYVICYQKMSFEKFKGFDKDYAGYSNPDNDKRGYWTLGDLTVGMTKDQRPNQFYDLVNPKTQKVYKPNPARVWGYIQESMSKLLKEDRIYFPDDITKRPMLKRFKNELKSDVNPLTTILDVGMNAEATRIIKDMFEANYFSYSKPLTLMKLLVSQITNGGDLILDFFAGSGTTAQAVLELNKEDGGNRKFILVQLPEKTSEDSEAYKAGYKTIADICKERIRKVIQKIQDSNGHTVLVSGSSSQTQLELENIKGWDDDEDIISEVILYAERVKNENGFIADISIFNKQLKQIKNHHYFDSLLFWVSSIGGLKKSNDTVTALFDLKNNDLTISNNYTGPLFFTDPQTQKQVIYYPGINSLQNSAINFSPPFTMLLIIKQDVATKDESILNSLVNDDYSIFTDNKSNLIIQSKKKIKDGIIDQRKKIIIIEFNGNNSRVFINNVLVESGKLDLVSLSGILLGKNNKHNPDFFTGYFYTCGIFKSIISDEFRSSLFNILN